MSSKHERMRDFQDRITKRLALVQEESLTASWLAASIGGERYLFPLVHSGEIVPTATISNVPYTKEWFLGVINFRGRIYGVVDLAAYIEFDCATRILEKSRPIRPTDTSFLGLNPSLGTNTVFGVEKIYGLKTVEDFVESEVATTNKPDWMGQQFIDTSRAAWQEINLQRLVQSQAFLNIGV
jgi:twitching motility protein PilI